MKCGLVLEGGARRGLFTAGVLDVFMENGISFPYVVGVSAGAEAAVNFVSGQAGRARRIMMPSSCAKTPLMPLHDVLSRELHTMVFDNSYGEDPFDFGAFFSSDTVCEIVATDCATAEPVYFSEKKDEERLLTSMEASCSLPALFPMVKLDGGEYADGSVADAIPFERAFEMGCDRVVAVLTKPKDEGATDWRKMRLVISRLYEQKYPVLYESLMNRIERYEESVAQLDKYEAEGKAMIIRPDCTYVKAFDANLEKLDAAYYSGRSAAEASLTEYDF